MIDLDAIKKRLEEWRQIKEQTSPGEWHVRVQRHGAIEVWARADRERCILDFCYQEEDLLFTVYAHNTPIEEDLQFLVDEVERLQGKS